MKRLFMVLGEEITNGHDWRSNDRFERTEKFFYQIWAVDEEEVRRIIDEKHPTRDEYSYRTEVYYQIAETLGSPN